MKAIDSKQIYPVFQKYFFYSAFENPGVVFKLLLELTKNCSFAKNLTIVTCRGGWGFLCNYLESQNPYC